MTQNLKIEVLTGDISIDGMVVTNLVTKEELSTAIVKKADLGTDGKIPTSQLPAEIVNTAGIVDEVKLQLETSIKDAVDESNAYAESYTDNALSSKADLTSGKVPLEQLPAIDQYPQFGTALSNLSTSILTAMKQRTDQLEKSKADLGEDGKVLREQIPSYEKISGLPEQLEVMSTQTAAVSGELDEHKLQTADQIDTLKENINSNSEFLIESMTERLEGYADKDAVKRGIANRYDSLLTYNSGERVNLANGDIVKSTIDGNANDPNMNMTGWLITGNVITVGSITDMTATINPQNGDVTIAKHYDKSTGRLKGGGIFIYDSSKVSLNDGGTVFNGWVRQYEGVVDVFMFGAQGFTYENPNIDDTQPIQKAIDTAKNVYIPEGMFKCNLVLTNSFNIQGSGKGTFLLPYDSSKPVMTNINRSSLGRNNDTVMDLEIRSLGFNDKNFTGTGFQYGLFPAQEGYVGVGRVVMRNVRIQGFDKGIHKVNGNIGNKYYDCSFEYNKYHVYGKGNQLSLGNPSAELMHCGCDYFYCCNFSESTISAVAYYDTSGGTGQWVFDSCVFQFNKGFAWFFEFSLPNGSDLFAPITSNNTWFESNATDTVMIDRLDGTTVGMQSKVRSVIGANAVIMTVTDEFHTRVGVGVANPQRAMHIHAKETPAIQLTSDFSGNETPTSGALIYYNMQDFYIENKQTGIVYILNQNGRVELNTSGDLTSNKGKIGYGHGAGANTVQIGSKSTTITHNYPSGVITLANTSLAPNESATFVLVNSKITPADGILVNVARSASGLNYLYSAVAHSIDVGQCYITIKNNHTATLAEAVQLNFNIISGTTGH